MKQIGANAQKEEKPRVYIMTGDLRVIVSRWLGDKGPFFLPDRLVFESLQEQVNNKLAEIFNPLGVSVIYFPWEFLKSRMLELVAEYAQNIPVISLDQIFIEPGMVDMFLDTTRIVKWSKQEAEIDPKNAWLDIGHGPRTLGNTISAQLSRILSQGKLSRMQDKRVIVVDDGTWTGNSLVAFQKLLASKGVRVERFIVGIGIMDEQKVLDTENVPFHWVELFEKSQTVDWINARDVFPGIGLSGRTLGEKIDQSDEILAMNEYYTALPMAGNYSAPYVLPLGDPEKWANIPSDHARDFSLFCLELTKKLYLKIEAETKRVTGVASRIKLGQLERPPYKFRKFADSFIVDLLDEAIKQL